MKGNSLQKLTRAQQGNHKSTLRASAHRMTRYGLQCMPTRQDVRNRVDTGQAASYTQAIGAMIYIPRSDAHKAESHRRWINVGTTLPQTGDNPDLMQGRALLVTCAASLRIGSKAGSAQCPCRSATNTREA